jgi:hypothetical protein
MALTTVQGELIESGAALENIGAGNITPSYLSTQAQYTGFKNRIINGDMVIAQRGTSFSFATGGGATFYGADRFRTFNYQWSAGSNPTVSNDTTVFPTGFRNSYKYATGATGLTFSTGGYQQIEQAIEGFNIADCYTGSIIISFWVRSSTAGQYNICLANSLSSFERYSTRNYTINSANTWEYKTITVDLSAGIASGGTWNTTNGTGLGLMFMLGAHSDRTGNTALNTWSTGGSPGYQFQTTGSVNLATIANSTFYITGVQVEKGTVATSFDYLPYTTELALCQRYFSLAYSSTGYSTGSTSVQTNFSFPVTMRATPTITISGTVRFTDGVANYQTTSNPASTFWSAYGGPVNLGGFSGMTATRPCVMDSTFGGFFLISAEL